MDLALEKLRPHHLLTLCVVTLLMLGVIMVQSASVNIHGTTSLGLSSRGLQQLTLSTVALATFVLVSRIPVVRVLGTSRNPLKSPAVYLTLITIGLCAAVLVPGIGKEVNGARRWISLGFTQLQPSEVAKWASVILLAWWLAARPVNVRTWWGFALTLMPMGAMCVLVVKEDFGTAALIAAVGFAMLMTGRAKPWHLAVLVLPMVLGAAYVIASEPYRVRRLTSFLRPWEDPAGDGYHMVQSLFSYASGGLMGRGLGNGVQKLGYLPEDTTDFIFSVICEELGLFGGLLVVFLFGTVLVLGLRAARNSNLSDLGRLLCFGVTMTFCLQAAINLAVATVSVPTKGMSLPLISAGGTALIITCAALGTMASVMRSAVEAAPAFSGTGLQPVIAHV